MRDRIKQWISLVALGVGLASTLNAQVNTAVVSGTVQDSTGAVIPGAKIDVLNAETGYARSATSGEQGFYSIQYVPVGTYTITCSSQGFSSMQSRAVLVAGQALKLDFSMQAKSVNEQVVVTAEAPLIDASSSQDNSTLASHQILSLPLSHDNWANLLTQTTGSIKQTSSANSSQNLGVSLNGLPSVGFNLTVDGTNAQNDPEMTIIGFYQAPNIVNTLAHDAIQEVSIVKGIVPATLGGAMSGGVNIITKNGTNVFHGDAWELNQVSALNARNYFATTKPRLTYNQYGGFVGGPIRKDRLFFFGAYEGARLSQFQVISGSVPTPFLRALAPSIYATELNDLPKVAQPSTDPAACSQSNPLPTLACATNATYQGTSAQRQNDGSMVARIDETLNSHNFWYARVTRNRPYIFAPALNVANPQITTTTGNAYSVGFVHLFQNLSSNSRFGYNRLRLSRNQIGFGANMENISFGFSTGGAELFTKAGRIVTGVQEFSITHGKHNIQFGGIVQRNDAGRTDSNTSAFTYSNLTQFLANTPSKASLSYDVKFYNDYVWQFGAFIQDDYRISSTLTLNLGMRYDHYTVAKESSGREFNRGYDSVLGYGFGAFQPAGKMYNADYHTGFQPRLGFAYSPTKLQAVIRGGFGILTAARPIYAGPISVSPTSATLAGANLNQTQIAAAATAGVPIAFPIPNPTLPTVLAGLQNAGVIGNTYAISSVDTNSNNPYAIQWTLAVQKTLPARMVVDLGYVGNHGLNEVFTLIANEPSRTTGIAPNPLWGTFNRFIPGDKSNYNALQAKLVKQAQFGLAFGANYTWGKSLSFGEGNLLQGTGPEDLSKLRSLEYGPTQYDIRHNFSSNVIWEIPFQQWFKTTSRAVGLLDRGWRTTFIFDANTGLPINITNGASAFSADRPNILVAKPYLSDYHTVTPASQGRHQYLLPSSQGSNPYGLAVGFTPPTGLCNGVSAQYCGGVQTLDGSLKRNQLRNIGQYTFDFNASKAFIITETVRLDFHVDAFNLTNHTNFTGLGLSTNSSTFGYFTSATPRTVQLGGKFTF